MSLAENCQIKKRGKNEIITVAKIILTNQMVLIVNCDFSSIVIIVYTVHPTKTISFEFPQIF